MKARVMQGFYTGVLSDDMLDLVVEQTQNSGDLRVGIDLLKRAAFSAERDARKSITGQTSAGRDEVSRYLHLSYTVKTLKDEEGQILKALAGISQQEKEMNAGEVYKSLHEQVGVGYTRFYEIIKKMDAMRLVNLQYRDGKGRTG